MSAPVVLTRALSAARRRAVARVALVAMPLLLAAGALAWREQSPLALAGVVAFAGLAAAMAWRAARAMHARWATRRLDERADLQDSADLLFKPTTDLGALQQLQRERLLQRLAVAPPDLRPAWPVRALALAWTLGLALIALALLLPSISVTPEAARNATREAAIAPATHTTLSSAELRLQPPAYTALPERTSSELSGKAPEGARLSWRLQFSPQPAAVDLVLHDGRRVALTREGDHWTASHVLDRSTLYRIVPRDALPLHDDKLHRLDALPDQPPQIRVLAPERSLTLRAPDQRGWPLSFEASDDHGLGNARLMITLAQGSGEQVTVSERSLALTGNGDGKLKRYARTLDLPSLGLAEGDDLIVRLVVTDNRAPSPQSARSASFILRWPLPPSTESTGMEGLVKKALPAYFRSQRQIIIDAEQLVSERRALAADAFVSRSDAIGVDQRILRMRYGQFLGEETEGEPEPPPVARDADGHDEADAGQGHDAGDGHDHGPAPGPAATTLGRSVNVLEDYGHTHDDAEAATLLDPETRALLKQALDAMWLSEGELRQGQPARALPHAYRALGFIKQVQQATRIYLARVGLELPPIDEARRMTGDRTGIADRRSGLAAASVEGGPALPLWRALASTEGGEAELHAFADWLQANEQDVDDALGLVAAVQAVRDDGDCHACRAALRARLWPLLPRPTGAAATRVRPDERGQAYLDALDQEAAR
ncbi:hypothetical protein [Arenimonas sp. MALMAid1274]|uniref:hypothetical protein n=1 Tax=Arenimonas sp. MALMAid1274 TaxID=3411630 RepID=UPI003BA0F5E3